jgi:hypothetical protein
VEDPVIVWLTEQDATNLAIIESIGLTREEAIRSAITRMAAECTPVVWALNGSLPGTAK